MEFVNTILNTQCVNEHSRNIDLYLKDPIVAKHLSHLHDKYVFVPADKVLYNMFLSLQTRPYTICFCPCRQSPIQYVFVPADKALYNMLLPLQTRPYAICFVPADKALYNMLLSLQTSPYTISFLCVNHIT
jgi:hypothetical protein